MKLVYFAWVRESIGKPEEMVNLPEDIQTVSQLLDWLAGRGVEYKEALRNKDRLRAAVDHTFVGLDHPLKGASEVALFPPVTGG